MSVLILSKSSSFNQHLKIVLGTDTSVLFLSSLAKTEELDEAAIVLIHAASFVDKIEVVLSKLKKLSVNAIGIAADKPSLKEMLALNDFGARAYFNSYMAEVHYRQMLQLVADGQHWYLPELLKSALSLANDAIKPASSSDQALQNLTRREHEIASRVSNGLSNKQIAKQCCITESTVKAHLTKIYKKSGVTDRVSLAILANTGHQAKYSI